MSCGTQLSLVTYMDNTKPKEGSYPTYTCTMNHWSQIKQQLPKHTGKNSRESRFTWYFSYEFHVKSSLRYKYVRYRWQQNFMWNLHEHLHVNFPKCTLHGKNFTGISHAAILICVWYECFKSRSNNLHNTGTSVLKDMNKGWNIVLDSSLMILHTKKKNNTKQV